MHRPTWRKSSFSVENGQCVELAALTDGLAIRDSKNPTGGALRFPASSWRAARAAIAVTSG
ncbi:DUF397 domain-containing protein [Actinokineospora baliensis]|uniref:DUF397 domain-containing protein n=1 Tax=Actinokineospora baliensis TaxID=547056 RepID=UPI001956155C|nr:DUF397 domain-containing protein [Actinokineospora baliensis]